MCYNIFVTSVMISSRIRQENRKAIRDFTLFDDTDDRGKVYNIEVQRENSGAKPRRARYNGALLDANCKDSGKYGGMLLETFVIFITEKDYWKEGLPLYKFERKCVNSGSDISFDDGLHIIYVNGAYRGKDKIGDLMHDFSCANPDDMKSVALRKSVSPYKKDEKEALKMCKTMERINKMAIEEAMEEKIIEALKLNLPTEQIQKIFNVSKSKIQKLQEGLLVAAN